MGLADAFGKEDRVEVTFSDFCRLMKEGVKAELMMNAVNCNVPHRFIRETMSGKPDGPDRASALVEAFVKSKEE